MKTTSDLRHDSIRSLVIKLAIPSMIAQLVNVLYSIIDRMYIGNIPEVGDIALAGAGICGPIVTLLSSFGTLVGLAGRTSPIEQFFNACYIFFPADHYFFTDER